MDNMFPKTIEKDGYVLTHDRFVSTLGFLQDNFSIYKQSKSVRLIFPFFPPLKIKKYTRKTNIMDMTNNYTKKEYLEMINEMKNIIK